MDSKLSDYIFRSEEILNLRSSDDAKFSKYDKELETMILFLEHAVKTVRNNRAKFYASCGKDFRAASTFIQYNKETNQYVCNIDGIKLRGNLGNIYDKKILQNDRIKAHQVIPCNKGNSCKNILLQTYCKFYHDPEDLLILKNAQIISKEYYEETIQLTRNFSSTSWMYSSVPNERMRSIGSLSTLDNDLKLMALRKTKDAEIANLKAQFMHDLLLLHAIEVKKE